MIEIQQTDQYSKWLANLKDRKAKFSIVARLHRIEKGNFGDVKPTSEGKIKELRINVGKGYRVYFARTGRTIVLLLIGGDKSTQSKNIRRAKQILDNME